MRKKISNKVKLKIADESKTPAEIYSIVLRGVLCTFKSIFKKYYVSENIEGLLSYINDKKIITAEEYKNLLAEAKDFYPVIICALLIKYLKTYTGNFKYAEIKDDKKLRLSAEIQKELTDFFIDWLCDIEIEPLLFYRLAISYKKPFNLNMFIKYQINRALTPIEEQILKVQLVDIICCYLIDQVAIQLGLAGLDYLDYQKENTDESKTEENISTFGEGQNKVKMW